MLVLDGLYYWVQVCSTQLRRRTDAALRETVGLTATQFGALYFIERSGGCRLSELATALHVNSSAVTTLASRLENNGMIRRERSQEDGRAYLVSATPEGRRALRRAHAQLEAFDSWVKEGFTADELETVMRFFRSTVDRLSSPPALESAQTSEECS